MGITKGAANLQLLFRIDSSITGVGLEWRLTLFLK